MFSVSKRETECLKQQPADSYLLSVSSRFKVIRFVLLIINVMYPLIPSKLKTELLEYYIYDRTRVYQLGQ